MTTTDKQSLISESVAATWIDIHPTREESDNTPCVQLPESHVQQSFVKSVLRRNRPLLPGWSLGSLWCQPSRHPGLPHSTSNKPPWSREVQFDKVIIGLLGLPGPIKPNMESIQIKAYHRGQNDAVLNWHRWGLPHRNLGIATDLSPPFPSECSVDPPTCPTRSKQHYKLSLYSLDPR
jgi:hypothetical protein